MNNLVKHTLFPQVTKNITMAKLAYLEYPLARTGILTLCPLLPFIKTSPKLYVPVTDRTVSVTVNLRDAPALIVIAGGFTSMATAGCILAVIT